MYPTITQTVHFTIEPEKYIAACDLSQLYELDLLLQKRIRQEEQAQSAAEPEKDNFLDNANKKHKIIKHQIQSHAKWKME